MGGESLQLVWNAGSPFFGIPFFAESFSWVQIYAVLQPCFGNCGWVWQAAMTGGRMAQLAGWYRHDPRPNRMRIEACATCCSSRRSHHCSPDLAPLGTRPLPGLPPERRKDSDQDKPFFKIQRFVAQTTGE